MSKLRFGNDSVVPVKDLRNPYNAGTGINADLLREGTIQVDDTVLRCDTSRPASGNLLLLGKNQQADKEPGQTAYGYWTYTYGQDSTAIGHNAKVSGLGVALGKRANAFNGSNQNSNSCSVSIGSYSFATGVGSIAVGANAGSDTYNAENTIAIGSSAEPGNAKGAIVIGANSKGSTSSSTDSSIIIGNNIDESNMDSPRTVIIGGMDNSVTSENRLKAYRDSVVIGYNAGSYSSGTPCYNVVVGSNASSKYYYSIAIGPHACAYSGGGIAIGSWAKTALGTDGSSSSGGIPSSTDISIGGDSFAYGTGNVSMGYSAGTCGWDNLAIGAWARVGTTSASRTNSIAIGNNAKVYGDRAIQIGPGTNNDSDSIQIGNTKLVKSDGTIPYQRLTTYVPLDGQVLFYDEDNNCLGWKDAGQSGGDDTYTLPVASRTTLGGVKVGSGLNATTDGTLSVVNQDIIWGTISGTLSRQTDLQNALDAKQGIIQYTNMPNASSRYNNKVAQYIGTETDLYKPGQFYQCTLDDYPTVDCTSTVYWGKLSVDPWMFANFVSKYFYNNDLGSVPSKLYRITYTNQYDGYGWVLYENETSVYVKDIYKMGIDAEGGEPVVNDTISVQLYMHETSDYAWRKLLVDAQVSVNNTLTSTSTKQALSANMGRVLSDKIQELSGISHFLAMWDTDTGIARYLDAGYRYASGDYFIIASVSPTSATLEGTYIPTGGGNVTNLHVASGGVEDWEVVYGTNTQTVHFTFVSGVNWEDDNGNQHDMQEIGFTYDGAALAGDEITVVYTSATNYKPAGTTYPGDTPTSKEVTDDPVQISDMYFYDGAHWIFLPSSSRQIAVDEYLDNTSRNPVENRVVTDALNDKVDASSTEGIYATDDAGATVKLSYGAGLEVDNGELQNKPVYGNFTGNIEDQTDLVEYISQHGGGSGGGSPIQITDVFVRNKNLVYKDGLTNDQQQRFKADYSDIFFKMSGNYDTLKSMRNDVYVTISRNSGANNSKRMHKMTVMNESNRFKTNKRFRCWRVQNQYNSYYYDSDQDGWGWYQTYNPKETEYYYFYVEGDYVDSSDLVSNNPSVFMVQTYEDDYGWAWGTSFNELVNIGSLNSEIDDAPYERCPQYDIDSVVSLNSEYSGDEHSSQYSYGNVVKNELTKMHCRVYNVEESGRVYAWCSDWDDDAADVYCMVEDASAVENTIPEHMDELTNFCSVDQFLDMSTFVEKRPELNYYFTDCSGTDFRTIINKLRRSTQDFPATSWGNDYRTNWNSYWLDYPMKPVRLNECKIYIYKSPFAEGDRPLAQKYAECVGRAYSFDEIESDSNLKDMLDNQDDLIFVLPYDTYYFWMRTFGWQKLVHFRYWGNDACAEPWERHDLCNALEKCTNNEWMGHLGMGRIFGFRNVGFQTRANRYFQRVQFNTINAKDLGQQRPSTLSPITRKFWINGNGVQGMTNQ